MGPKREARKGHIYGVLLHFFFLFFSLVGRPIGVEVIVMLVSTVFLSGLCWPTRPIPSNEIETDILTWKKSIVLP